jgi:hypothetical protein
MAAFFADPKYNRAVASIADRMLMRGDLLIQHDILAYLNEVGVDLLVCAAVD